MANVNDDPIIEQLAVNLQLNLVICDDQEKCISSLPDSSDHPVLHKLRCDSFTAAQNICNTMKGAHGNGSNFNTRFGDHLKTFELYEGKDDMVSDQYKIQKQFTEQLKQNTDVQHEFTQEQYPNNPKIKANMAVQSLDYTSTTAKTVTKRKVDSTAEESPRLAKLRKFSNDSTNNLTANSNTSSKIMKSSRHAQDNLQKRIGEYDLPDSSSAQFPGSVYSSTTDEILLEELKASIEQLAYEEYENYYLDRLSEGPDNEHLNYDEDGEEIEFWELVREYEEKLFNGGRISPIADLYEGYAVEQNNADFESEAEKARETVKKIT